MTREASVPEDDERPDEPRLAPKWKRLLYTAYASSPVMILLLPLVVAYMFVRFVFRGLLYPFRRKN
jgi:hypothetical protein